MNVPRIRIGFDDRYWLDFGLHHRVLQEPVVVGVSPRGVSVGSDWILNERESWTLVIQLLLIPGTRIGHRNNALSIHPPGPVGPVYVVFHFDRVDEEYMDRVHRALEAQIRPYE